MKATYDGVTRQTMTMLFGGLRRDWQTFTTTSRIVSIEKTTFSNSLKSVCPQTMIVNIHYLCFFFPQPILKVKAHARQCNLQISSHKSS